MMKEKNLLLISANQHTDPYPVYPIGLSYLSTYLKEHLTDFNIFLSDLNFNTIEELKKNITKINPKYIGISFRNIDDVNSINKKFFVTQYKKIIDQIKTVSHAKIIIGGSGFSIFPELMFKTLEPNFGIYGEGEDTLLKLIQKLENNTDYSELSRLVYKNNGQCIFNKDESYFSDLTLNFEDQLLDFYWKKSGMLNVQTKRGCPYNCIYCTYPLIEGRKVRTLNTDKIVETLKNLYYQKGIDYIFFTDSVFNINNKYNYELAEKIIASGIKINWGGYFTFTHLDENLLKILKKSGLKHIEFGTEAISDTTLKAYGKNFTVNDVIEKSALCNKLEIDYAHFLILGGYGETDQTLNETFENSKRIENSVFFPYVGMRIYPGTKLQQYAIQEGIIDKKDDLFEPKYYLAKNIDFDSLKHRANQTGRRWVFPDEDTTIITNKLREKNKKGPLWEYMTI
ncbi:MAG TPA: lipid biosynthesis B12-binding/radical SAM protein [Bacteroidales bacterium]|nr:lipid biosynthesis B12-binding/radical SAM protein [Bacteroidales bacterium]